MKRLAMVVIAAMVKDGEKCTTDLGCVCGSPPIDVETNCTCKIDSLGGTGTLLSFVSMRRRAPPG